MVTSLAFGAYLAFNLSLSNTQASLLEDISAKRYPLQIKLQEASFTLRFIQAELEDAVTTGEFDSLQTAEQLQQQFLGTMSEIESIDAQQGQLSAEIRTAFGDYYLRSYELARQLISGEADLLASINLGSENAVRYAQIVDRLDQFKATELRAFSDSVDRVTSQANLAVNIGVPAGLVTMIVVFLLAYVTGRQIIGRVNHMVKTLRDIAQDDGDMSVRIPIAGRDEMAELAFWFNQFIGQLEHVTNESTAKIRRLAYTDALTKLPNRRLFNSHLKSELRRCHENQQSLAVMFLDLDNFKAVNDQMGHDAGDELVREVGRRLSTTLRGHDLVAHSLEAGALSGQHLVARMGGDEFMLIVTDLGGVENAEIIAERVRTTVLEPIEIDETKLEIGVSIGISIYPKDSHSAEELIINADLAMYEAKSRGKNNYCLFRSDLENAARRNLQLESALRNAIIHDELELVYQPKYDLATQEMAGAEALLRWTSPKFGMVSPAEFIPVAEQSGLIFDIDEWVMRKACRQIRQWIDLGYRQLPIAINISAKLAARTDLIDKVRAAIESAELPDYSLEVEITETSALSNMQLVAENIRVLKDLKVSVALDDFGAGHSSLALLKYCEIDTLKIDRGFLSELGDVTSKPIYRAVIELARVLNMKTVAEGIEKTAELELLRDMGCDLAQGFLLAKPMSVSDYETCLMSSCEVLKNA